MSQLPQFFRRGAAATGLPSDQDFTDGLLETMRCQRGRVSLWPLHRARLLRCGDVAPALLREMDETLHRVAAICPQEPSKLRLRWGWIDGRQYWDLSVTALDAAPELAAGARLFPCRTRLRISDSANPGCKSLRRTGYNRASAELPAGEVCEGLMLDGAGRVIESLRCNLLARFGATWVTPDLRRCGVRGVMREWLASHLALEQVDMDLARLCEAEEVALCNSVRGLVPVRELIGYRRWPARPEVRRLQQLIAEELW